MKPTCLCHLLNIDEEPKIVYIKEYCSIEHLFTRINSFTSYYDYMNQVPGAPTKATLKL